VWPGQVLRLAPARARSAPASSSASPARTPGRLATARRCGPVA